MRVKPYQKSVNEENNMNYELTFVGTKEYQVRVIIDELNDNLITWKSCECPDHQYRERDCKHIIEGLKLMKDWGVEMREEYKHPVDCKGCPDCPGIYICDACGHKGPSMSHNCNNKVQTMPKVDRA